MTDRTAHRPRSTASTRIFWCTGAAALMVALFAAWRRHWVCDDAFISFRYAENLVQGFGLVYNQAERVEGYSNFLWTIWTAFTSRTFTRPRREALLLRHIRGPEGAETRP